MTMAELIKAAQMRLQGALAERTACQEGLVELRSRVEDGYEPVGDEVTAAIAKREAADARVDELTAEVESLRAEQARDEQIAKMQTQVEDTGVTRRAYDQVTRVSSEERTYNMGNDRTGALFLRDVLRSSVMNDLDAQQRLSRHMAEERVERGTELEQRTLAPISTDFAGLVVPQYLTDLVAPYAKAGRPLAEAVRKHPLPAGGMTVNISRITTATSAAVQTQGDAVSETAMDDTILTINVNTIAGSQTVSRQAAERGEGVLDVILEDLLTAYHSQLDSEILNQATNGLVTTGATVAYTDASPTAAELFPIITSAAGKVEAALKNRDSGDTIVVMHPRRWWWLTGSLASTFPIIQQAGTSGFNAGVDYGTRYGPGFRGMIAGLPVVTDANIVTNLGAATNEDQIYVVSASEIHLWEQPGAPLFIRTDTGPNMKALGIDLVAYGYSAFTTVRYAHAQTIGGTGLTAPA